MFYAFGISLSFFLSFLLFTKKGKSKADGILGLWLIVIGIHLFLFHFQNQINKLYLPYYIYLPCFPLLHGPMLYFYVTSITNQNPTFKKNYLFHFVPLLLVYLVSIRFFLLPYSEKLKVFELEGKGFEIESWIKTILIMTSGVLYTLLCLHLLNEHKKNIENRFSEIEKINLIWLRFLIYGFGFIWIAVFTQNDFLIFSLVTLFVILLGYFGIKQMGIFSQKNIMSDIDLSFESEKEKYEDTKVIKPELLEVHTLLIDFVTKEKPYLNPELTLPELAKLIGVHTNILSSVINTIESKSFYDLINQKRIEEFKQKVILPENQKYTLLTLAYDCGFNSKTAFYRNFKNLTGQSPSQYLNEQKIHLN
jgi:AraC-like DNA-binding protein